MSLMESLGFVKRAAPANQQQTSAPNPGEKNPNPNMNPNPPVPDTAKSSPNSNKESVKSDSPPLDKWADLWKPSETDPKAPEPFDPNKIYEINEQELNKQLGELDFTQNLNPQVMSRIVAGGEDAAKAMMEAMNHATRSAFGLMTRMSAKMINDSSGRNANHFSGMMDKAIKNNAVRSALKSSNPALNHPAVSPMLEGLQSQLQGKYPQASPEEIRQKAEEYLSDFIGALSTKSGNKDSANSAPSGEQDFSSFLDEFDLNSQ